MVAAGIVDIGVIVGDTRVEVMAVLGDGSQWCAAPGFSTSSAARRQRRRRRMW